MPTIVLGSSIPKDKVWTRGCLPTACTNAETSVNQMPAQRWVWLNVCVAEGGRAGGREARPVAAIIAQRRSQPTR